MHLDKMKEMYSTSRANLLKGNANAPVAVFKTDPPVRYDRVAGLQLEN